MNIQFKAYHDGNYNEVCQFLIDISQVYKGFVKHDQSENILACSIANIEHYSVLPAGITLKSLDAETDVYKHKTVLCKGFDHDVPVPIDDVTIQKQKAMLSATHMNPSLHIAAVVV